MKWQQVMTLVISRIKQVIGLYAFVLIPMWVMFFLNDTVFFGLWNIFGIVPRTLDIGSMIGVFASWTMHGNFSHLVGNSLTLMQILFLFGLFENNAYRTILKLIVASGYNDLDNSFTVIDTYRCFRALFCDARLYDRWGSICEALGLFTCLYCDGNRILVYH